MTLLKRIMFPLFALVLTACPYPFSPDDYEFEYTTIVTDTPVNLEGINSDMDDLYPSMTEDQTSLYFCSNRENANFSIYSISLPEAAGLHNFITSNEPGESVLNTVLSSDFNDKCPYIYEDIMVFTSDREGGHGGFDLYMVKTDGLIQN